MIYKLASKGKIPGGWTGGNPGTNPGIPKDREKTEPSNRGKGGRKIGRTEPISGVLRSQVLQFTPTMGPIHVAKDISANGHSSGGATISQVTDSFLEVFVSEPFMGG
jgi:hypothetical protein